MPGADAGAGAAADEEGELGSGGDIRRGILVRATRAGKSQRSAGPAPQAPREKCTISATLPAAKRPAPVSPLQRPHQHLESPVTKKLRPRRLIRATPPKEGGRAD